MIIPLCAMSGIEAVREPDQSYMLPASRGCARISQKPSVFELQESYISWWLGFRISVHINNGP